MKIFFSLSPVVETETFVNVFWSLIFSSFENVLILFTKFSKVESYTSIPF